VSLCGIQSLGFSPGRTLYYSSWILMLRLCPCVALRAWDSVLVKFDNERIVPGLIRYRTCYGLGVYCKCLVLFNRYLSMQITRRLGRFAPIFYLNCEHVLFVYILKQRRKKKLCGFLKKNSRIFKNLNFFIK